MRDVDHHSLPIHFPDYFFPEIGEAVVGGLVGGGIGPFVVYVVGEGHVTDAEGGIAA